MTDARELVRAFAFFRYGEQALAISAAPIWPDPPETPEFPEAAAKLHPARVPRNFSKGPSLPAFFTSYAQMREPLRAPSYPYSDYPILLHGNRTPAKRSSSKFRTTAPNAVLFGTLKLLGKGVDVQGEALSCVIIDRLPFAVPQRPPVVQARMKAIERSRRQALLSTTRVPIPRFLTFKARLSAVYI